MFVTGRRFENRDARKPGYVLHEEHVVALHDAQELELVRVSPDSPLERKPNSENRFFTRLLLQLGQTTVDESREFLTSSSKTLPHFKQSYSYIGMAFSSQCQNARKASEVSCCF